MVEAFYQLQETGDKARMDVSWNLLVILCIKIMTQHHHHIVQ